MGSQLKEEEKQTKQGRSGNERNGGAGNDNAARPVSSGKKEKRKKMMVGRMKRVERRVRADRRSFGCWCLTP